jgi:hypothetical protein
MTDPQRLTNLEEMSLHDLLATCHTSVRLWLRAKKDVRLLNDMLACNAECCRRGKREIMEEANRLSLMTEEAAAEELRARRKDNG